MENATSTMVNGGVLATFETSSLFSLPHIHPSVMLVMIARFSINPAHSLLTSLPHHHPPSDHLVGDWLEGGLLCFGPQPVPQWFLTFTTPV